MNFKRIISTLLTFCILLSSVAVSAFAQDVKVDELEDGSKVISANSVDAAMKYLQDSECEDCATSSETEQWERKTICNGQCGHAPAIIVHGILQSQVYPLDQDGKIIISGEENKTPEEIKAIVNDDEKWAKIRKEERPRAVSESLLVQNFFDFDKLFAEIPEIIAQLLKAIITKNTDGFSDYLSEFIDENLSVHYFNDDGTRKNDIHLVEYWSSVAEARGSKGNNNRDLSNYFESDKRHYNTEADAIYDQVDTEEYANLIHNSIEHDCSEHSYYITYAPDQKKGELKDRLYCPIGEDHLYFYTYPSFGDTYESAERLNKFIQMVKAETGHEKVNLVFISLGGTVGTAYFDMYTDTTDVNKAIFASSALDGSSLIGDIFAGNYANEDSELMLTDFLPDIMRSFASKDGNGFPYWSSYIFNILLRIIHPALGDDVEQVLKQAVQTIVDEFLVKCPSMWSLIPSSMYPELSEKYLSDPKFAELKAKTDRYYNAQITNKTRLPQLNDRDDMSIFITCGYGLHITAILDSYYTKHSDSVIESSSESGGAYFAPIGTTLPDDYKPAIDESYISPNKMVDAGAGYLPDNTWFVYGQGHMTLQDAKHDYISMCVHLAFDENIKDARVNNGGYPQFNNYRDTSDLQRLVGYVYTAASGYTEYTKTVKDAQLSQDKLAKLDSVARNAANVLEAKYWDPEATLKAEAELLDLFESDEFKELSINVENKFFDKYDNTTETKIHDVLLKVCKTASKIVDKHWGYKSFWS